MKSRRTVGKIRKEERRAELFSNCFLVRKTLQESVCFLAVCRDRQYLSADVPRRAIDIKGPERGTGQRELRCITQVLSLPYGEGNRTNPDLKEATQVTAGESGECRQPTRERQPLSLAATHTVHSHTSKQEPFSHSHSPSYTPGSQGEAWRGALAANHPHVKQGGNGCSGRASLP